MGELNTYRVKVIERHVGWITIHAESEEEAERMVYNLDCIDYPDTEFECVDEVIAYEV